MRNGGASKGIRMESRKTNNCGVEQVECGLGALLMPLDHLMVILCASSPKSPRKNKRGGTTSIEGSCSSFCASETAAASQRYGRSLKCCCSGISIASCTFHSTGFHRRMDVLCFSSGIGRFFRVQMDHCAAQLPPNHFG